MRGSHLALLAALSVAACSVYDTSLLKQNATGSGGNGQGGFSGGNPGGGGGQSAGANGGAGGGVCGSARWPDRPSASSIITPGGTQEIVGVMSSIQLGDAFNDPNNPPTLYRTLGFDMDGKCTTLTTLKTATECHIPSYSGGALDGPDGRDNAVGQIVQLTRNILGDKLFSSDIYSKQLQQGVTNVLVRVQDFNGEANDDQVTVTTLVSAPFLATNAAPPQWMGADIWPISSDSYKADGTTPLFQDKLAYVVNNQVVVSLQAADLKLVVGLSDLVKINLDLVLHGAEIVCDLQKTAVGHWGWQANHCVLGARWLADDLIRQLSHFGDPGQAAGTPLCTDSNLYSTFKKNICGLIDITDNGVASTGTDCNALSMGLVFDMEPALIGNVYPVDPIGEKCIKPGTQPSLDSCENQSDGGLVGGGGTGGTSSGGTGGTKAEAGPGNGGAKDASKD
jgi:hypothetical protein